jgi:hypothetical protein
MPERRGSMRRTVVVTLVVVVCALGVVAGSASAANENASCNGILVSSTAGQPGLVAELTRMFHDIAKDLGFPPGVIVDAPGGQLHAGSVEACLAGLGA